MIQAKHYLTLTRATAKRGLVAMLVATLIMTTACEKPIINEGSVGSGSAAATRAATDITELCSRINIAIFDGDGAENFPANTRVRPVVTVTINKE